MVRIYRSMKEGESAPSVIDGEILHISIDFRLKIK